MKFVLCRLISNVVINYKMGRCEYLYYPQLQPAATPCNFLSGHRSQVHVIRSGRMEGRRKDYRITTSFRCYTNTWHQHWCCRITCRLVWQTPQNLQTSLSFVICRVLLCGGADVYGALCVSYFWVVTHILQYLIASTIHGMIMHISGMVQYALRELYYLYSKGFIGCMAWCSRQEAEAGW